MGKYADGTKVPVMRSLSEIEHVLSRYGATGFQYTTGQDKAGIAFLCDGRMIKIVMGLDGDDRETARRWRCMVLCLKSKLESVQTGIETFDEAFMAHVVMPAGPHQGKTIGEVVLPEFQTLLETGETPRLLPGPAE